MQLIEKQTEELTLKLSGIYGIEISRDYILLETKNINISTDDISKIIKTINNKINNDLTIKLNLYNEIAKDRVEESIELSPNKDMISMEDYLIYIREKLDESNQEITITVMQDILSKLNSNALLDNYALGYILSGIDKNIQLDQLKKRSKELLEMDIIQDGYIADSKNVRMPIIKKIILSSILGLVISLIYVYFYLTVSLRLLKKKLTFLLYQEK